MKMQEKEALVPMLCYKDIEQTSVEWLWFPYISIWKTNNSFRDNPGEGENLFCHDA